MGFYVFRNRSQEGMNLMLLPPASEGTISTGITGTRDHPSKQSDRVYL